MGTRITQSMMTAQLTSGLNRNLHRMQDQQTELTTSMRINKPSDDPVGITYSLRYRSELSTNSQFESNANAAVSALNYTDTTLGEANDVLQRVRELLVQAANGTNSTDSLQAIKSEVSQLTQQMVTIGNTQFNGKYIFNGQMTDKPPYSLLTAETDVTDNKDVNFQLGLGVKVPVSVNGNQVFGAAGDSNNVFKVLKDISTALDNNDSANLSHDIGRLDAGMSTFLNARSDVGALNNRITLILNRIKDTGTNLTSEQSKVEDADIPTVITNLKTEENVYEASLDVGAKIISPTLLDFLK